MSAGPPGAVWRAAPASAIQSVRTDLGALTGRVVTLENSVSTLSYDSTVTDDTKTVGTVGGVAQNTLASSLKGLTFTALFDRIFFPVQQPTATPPSVTLTRSAHTFNVQRVGDTLSDFNINIIPNRGSISQPFTTPLSIDYAGLPTDVGSPWQVTGATTATVTNVGATPDPVLVSGYVVVQGNNQWNLTGARFADGVVPLDSTGAPSTTLAQWVSTNSVTVNPTSFQGSYDVQFSNGSEVDGTTYSVNLSPMVAIGTSEIFFSQNFTHTSANRHRMRLPDVFVDGKTITVFGLNSFANPVEWTTLNVTSAFTRSAASAQTVGGIGYTTLIRTSNSNIGGDVDGNPAYRVVIT